MLREFLAVAVGGAVGSVGRYGIILLFSLIGASWSPIATLVANVLGCFAIGWLAQWAMQAELTNHWLVAGARIGLLGGLTTFSSFAIDILRLYQSDKVAMSVGLVVAHLLLGLLAVAGGLHVARSLALPA